MFGDKINPIMLWKMDISVQALFGNCLKDIKNFHKLKPARP